MEWLILVLVALLPAYAAFRLVVSGRALWGWALPSAAAGLGVLGVLYVDSVAVSEQSRAFGSFAILFLFGLMAIVLGIGCIAGHVARGIRARVRGARE